MPGNVGISSSGSTTVDTPVSTYQAALLGANNPAQDTLSHPGVFIAPNALFRAMNQQTLTQITALSEGSVGTFLQSRGKVNGNTAAIINASLDYILGGNKSQNLPAISTNVNYTNSKRTFIPIILKTDFLFSINNTSRSNSDSNNLPAPLYIIFDSTPDDITFSKTANWGQTPFLGRPEPVWTYQNSSATTFSLVGKFYAESVQAHGRLLKLSDYIMSLATPSLNNYMPSPVTVFIGQWKELHCIVNQVSIKYSGPWSIQVTKEDLASAQPGQEPVIKQALDNATKNNIPSHAPYLFEATFSFTVVNPDNKVQYAEQVVSAEFKKDITADLTAGNTESIAALANMLNSAYPNTTPYQHINTGLYGLDVATQYTFTTQGVMSTATSSTLNYTTAADNLNIYGNANNINRLSDQGVISNAVNSQMLSLFQKANPNSTRTPETTTSLNPFKKLF